MREVNMQEGHTLGKIFAVGDIHGCYQKLKVLLDRLPFNPEKDLLIFLGDYLNRGPESRQVITFLLDLKRRAHNVIFLLGNHEHSLLEYARDGDPDDLRTLRPLGVEATLQSYGDRSVRSMLSLEFLPDDHKEFLNQLVLYYKLKGYLFIHAGVIPGEDLENCPLHRLLTVRENFLNYRKSLDCTVVFGHTPFETPFVTQDKIGIDTGAAYGNMLTAVELPRLRFYHA